MLLHAVRATERGAIPVLSFCFLGSLQRLFGCSAPRNLEVDKAWTKLAMAGDVCRTQSA